ncbi:MAG: YggT family protein [Deltaproteobacteria bacterium]|nr:YggT family protein [Deltaproteobacteria bacterium]
MFVIGNFLEALAAILNIVLTLYMYIVLARVILSWVNPDPYNPIVQFLHRATDPVLDRVRRLLPLHAGGIDFSPIIVFLAIIFLQTFLVQTLQRIAFSLK